MSLNPFSQNNNVTNSDLYTVGGYEKKKIRVIAIVAVIFVIIGVIALLIASRPNKYIQSATIAARKVTPNAQVRDVKVAGGFALAIVSDPTSNSQANAGNTTVFKVYKDGSMKQIANSSSFSPLDLLKLGIPLSTQAKLTGQSISQVKQTLADICGYNGGNTPGYSSFDGSFSPGGWQIDSATLDTLEQMLSKTISNKNSQDQPNQKIICVNATRKNSNAMTDTKTYISTFTLNLQFITSNGIITSHTFTFSIGPNYYRSYTLDGQTI